jgi:hypothetical protein
VAPDTGYGGEIHAMVEIDTPVLVRGNLGSGGCGSPRAKSQFAHGGCRIRWGSFVLTRTAHRSTG